MKWASFLIGALMISSSAFADTSMKAKVLLAGDTQSWLSGNKRRMEVQVPLVGKIVTITRVDRGVEWILNVDKKIYQERSIALPYKPSEDSGSSDQNPYQNEESQDSSESQNDCVPLILKAPGTKTIAGYTVTGFSLTCEGKGSQGMIWMAPPLGPLAAVSGEWEAYYKAHATALYANFPPAERKELISVTAKFGDALKDLLTSRLGKPTKFPKGVIMAVEGKFTNNGTGPSKTVYEVKEITPNPVDPNLFEIPAGYQKVPDITKALLQSSFQNFQQMFDMAKKFFSQSGMTGAGTQGNPLQAAIDWAKKAYHDFMAKQSA